MRQFEDGYIYRCEPIMDLLSGWRKENPYHCRNWTFKSYYNSDEQQWYMIDTYYSTDFVKVTKEIEEKFTCVCKLSDYREVTPETFEYYSPSDKIGPIALNSGGYYRPKYLVRKGAKPDPLALIRVKHERIEQLKLQIVSLQRDIEVLEGQCE